MFAHNLVFAVCAFPPVAFVFGFVFVFVVLFCVCFMCWVCVLRTSLRPEQLSIPRSLQLFRRNGSFRGQHKLKRGVIVAAMSYRHEANPVMMEHVRVCGHTVVLPHELSVTLTLVWVCVCLSICACWSTSVFSAVLPPRRAVFHATGRRGTDEAANLLAAVPLAVHRPLQHAA